MGKVAIKRIKEKALKIQNGWNEGAPDVIEFRKTKKSDFDAKIAEAQSIENDIADLRVQLTMKENQCETVYSEINEMNVDIHQGIKGHKDFGDNHPILTMMDFVRKSDRASGLHRGKKNNGDGTNGK